MQLTVDRYGPLTIVRLAGQMNLATCTAITPQLEQGLQEVQALVVDMSRVEFMSSAGVRFLLLLQRRLAAQNVSSWALIQVPEAIADTLQVTGFSDLLRFSGLSEAAIRERIDAGQEPLRLGEILQEE